MRKAFKPRPDEWLLLFRILDAMAAGAKDKEIAEVLFPNLSVNLFQRVYDKKEQALRYVKQDYRFIPYSDE